MNNFRRNSDLKMALTVRLVGDKSVHFKILYISDEVNKHRYRTFYRDKWGFEYIKNSFKFIYNKDSFIMPDYVYPDIDYSCTFDFVDNKERHKHLRRLNESLIGLSKCKLFEEKNKRIAMEVNKNKVIFVNEFWFIY